MNKILHPAWREGVLCIWVRRAEQVSAHVADIVGSVRLLWSQVLFFPLMRRVFSHPFQEDVVYAVEFSPRSGRDLINMEDARFPLLMLFLQMLHSRIKRA
jgi:hypothetical protein